MQRGGLSVWMGLLVVLVAGSAGAVPYDLVYDAGDGSLTISGVEHFDSGGTPNEYGDDSGGLFAYVIESAGGFFLESPDPNEHLNHLRPLNLFFLPGDIVVPLGASSSSPTVLSAINEVANLHGIPAIQNEMLLGQVLPAGLSEQAFRDALTPIDPHPSPRYVSSVGQPWTAFNLVYVPEPAALGVLGLGSVFALRRRVG